MNGLLRKKIDISFLKKIDTRFGDSALWQFVKFNLVSFSITLLQLALANLLPLIFDGLTSKLPPVLRPVFRPEALFEGHSPYVVDGVVTWGYVLPFLFYEYEDNFPRQGKPQRACHLSDDSKPADSLFHLAAGMDHRQIVCNDLCGARQNHCRFGRRTGAGSRVVPARKIRVVQEGIKNGKGQRHRSRI